MQSYITLTNRSLSLQLRVFLSIILYLHTETNKLTVNQITRLFTKASVALGTGCPWRRSQLFKFREIFHSICEHMRTENLQSDYLM